MTARRRTTRLWLVCHAATSALRSPAFPLDEPPEPTALRELRAAHPQLRNADRCWTGLALRAVQTAEALGLSPIVEPLLRECDYGEWAGRSLDDVHSRDPQGIAAWLSDPEAAPHGGESIAELIGRVAPWLNAAPCAGQNLSGHACFHNSRRNGSRTPSARGFVLAHRCRAALRDEAQLCRRALDSRLPRRAPDIVPQALMRPLLVPRMSSILLRLIHLGFASGAVLRTGQFAR